MGSEMRRRGSLGAAVALAACLVASCGLLSGLDSIERANELGAGDAADAPRDTGVSADAGRSTDGASEARDTSADAPPDVAPDTSRDPCAVDAGVSFVRAGSFCIDGTEVTNQAYALFLSTHTTANTPQPTFCSWNVDYTPKGGWPAGSGAARVPVHYVNWCDAYVYCESVGKRLCGNINGGPNDVALLASSTNSQWYAACAHGADGRTYPYGSTFDATACNGGAPPDGGANAVAVGSFPRCVGGYPGIFDMSGNVREWEDSCKASTGALDECRVRGNASDDTDVRCATDRVFPRNYASLHTGFRCCSVP